MSPILALIIIDVNEGKYLVYILPIQNFIELIKFFYSKFFIQICLFSCEISFIFL